MTIIVNEKRSRTFSRVRPLILCDEAVVTLLLVVGLCAPTSVNGEMSTLFMTAIFAVLLGLLLYLVLRHGARPGAVMFISLPIMIVMSASTILSLSIHDFRFGWGIFAEFGLVALLFALDLRHVRPGRVVNAAFVIANVLNIAAGIAILVGNDWIAQFLTAFYTQFYPELVPTMLSLHKPVLTFGTHSLAGLFLYLFFWLNWETYRIRGGRLALLFAVTEFILLLTVTSFTSFALAALALAQMGLWLWKRSRKLFAVATVSIALMGFLGTHLLGDEVSTFGDAPVLIGALLNSNLSGPLARYGPGGDLRATINYWVNHPFSPVGFTTSSSIYIVDSGPLEYLLRGSIPLLLLMYAGLYRFLRYNLSSRYHALTLFFVIVAFETGFTALSYFRSAYLLAFFVVYLNQFTPAFKWRNRTHGLIRCNQHYGSQVRTAS